MNCVVRIRARNYKPTSVPEFGRAMEIAVAQVPHACECVCRKCKDNLKKYGEKKIVMMRNATKLQERGSAPGGTWSMLEMWWENQCRFALHGL